ncbi:DNA polymerase delta subunit 1 [Pancytospora epiphaga]|nr:DNA polymerase delta subunit 1 [Pancytospora epiphaga]
MSDLVILQTHIDFSVDHTSLDIPMPVISIYGNRMDCTPVQVNVHGFLPYLYALPTSTCENTEQFRYNLEMVLSSQFSKGKCMKVKLVSKRSIYGYSTTNKTFFQIFFNTPYCLRSAKALLEGGLIVDGRKVRFQVFESNFPFVLRFMCDLGVTGMCYLKIKEQDGVSTQSIGAEAKHSNLISTSFESLEPLPLVGEYMRMLPLKILSLDIECVGDSDSFPVASKDPIIQIGNTIQRFGDKDCRQDIFCLGETAVIPGANVHWFHTEEDLLLAWIDFLRKEDPDVIIGYNIKGFDFPYILDRGAALKLDSLAVLGRTNRKCKVYSKQQSSSAFGAFDSKDISIDGRLVFDLLHIIRRDHKLRSYSLNAVSFHFLGEQKEDVPYSSMYGLQHGNKDTRRRIASYCLRDTYLPMRLFDKLNILLNFSELSRATHVPIEYFSTRGNAIKVLSQIYYEAKRSGFLIPDMDNLGNDDGFEGAFVMDPMRGFYSDPIAVLDFSSLYPSIIISKNMCYTTLILNNEQNINQECITTPSGDRFCPVDTQEGLLPRILKNLLSARKEAKRELKNTEDPFLRRALDGRQIALKVCANSIYGFTGAPAGQLPCIPISQSTTAFGREMIAFTKKLIEETFTRSNNYAFDCQVIYGDTDSVMINFVNLDRKKFNGEMGEIFSVAKDISKLVTDSFEKPISLEFEKVYCPYLLMNKKRYAGLIYTTLEKPDRIDMKGIETVRRDNCELVKNVIQTCLDKILIEKDVEGAIRYVKETVRKIYTERIDLSQLVISKTYTKSNYTSKQAHTELVEKLRKRGAHVGIGDRIPYVMVKRDKKSLGYEKSEDPVYVLENSLPIDKEYYIEQQLTKPVYRLFEPIMDNVSSLFHGEHTQVIKESALVKGPMNMFVNAIEVCVGCQKAGKMLCDECSKDFPKHYMSLQADFDEKATQFNECWVECQRCQGSVLNEVLCVNRICPIWYKRTKLKKEIAPLQHKLDSLRKLSW